jgi:hypothetical protein
MRLTRYVLALALAALVLPAPARAQDEAHVRLILLDMTLGHDYGYYRAHQDKLDVRVAVQRWDHGVRVADPGRYERRMMDQLWHLTYRGTTRQVAGMDIRLTTAGPAPEVRAPVQAARPVHPARPMPAGHRPDGMGPPGQSAKAMPPGHGPDGMGPPGQRARSMAPARGPDVTPAGQRAGATSPEHAPEPAAGPAQPVRVSSVTVFDEARVRLVLLDLSMGATLADYQSHTDDINVRMALDRWNHGVRVTNVQGFERRKVDGHWREMYRGSSRQVGGMDVRLTTDPGH